jgi:hypothetical protein
VDCAIDENGGDGISVEMIGAADLRGLDVRRNEGCGLSVNQIFAGSDTGTTVRESTFSDNGTNGLKLAGSAASYQIESVDARGDAESGIYVGHDAFAHVTGCVLEGNQGFGLFVESLETTAERETPVAFGGWVTGSGNTFGTGESANVGGSVAPSWVEGSLNGDAAGPETIRLSPGVPSGATLERVPPGSQIELAAGEYTEPLSIQRDVVIRGMGETPGETILQKGITLHVGSNATVSIGNLIVSGSVWCRIEGPRALVTLDSVAVSGLVYLSSFSTSSSLVLRDCSIDGESRYYYGIAATGFGELQLSETTIADTLVAGILLFSSLDLSLDGCRILRSGFGLAYSGTPEVSGGLPLRLNPPYSGAIQGSGNWIPIGDAQDANSRGIASPESLLEVLPDDFLSPSPE